MHKLLFLDLPRDGDVLEQTRLRYLDATSEVLVTTISTTMTQPEASNKRLAQDSEDAPAAKRGRGRPRKDPNAPRPPPKDPNAPKRGRGRPRKDPNAAPVKTPAEGTGRGRGRPRKDPNDPSAKTVGAGRGRPKKSEATSSDTQATSSITKSPKSASKGGAKLSDIIGAYDINCKGVEENWPDMAEDMHLVVTSLSHTQSALIASFSLGVLEGTMLLASGKDTLEQVRRDVEGRTSPKAKKSSVPALTNRTVYFAWRGRDTGDSDQVHPGSHGGQTGVLKFKDESCASFSGVGAFPALGSECKFTGTKTNDAANEVPEPWNNFNEEAYEEANHGRWG